MTVEGKKAHKGTAQMEDGMTEVELGLMIDTQKIEHLEEMITLPPPVKDLPLQDAKNNPPEKKDIHIIVAEMKPVLLGRGTVQVRDTGREVVSLLRNLQRAHQNEKGKMKEDLSVVEEGTLSTVHPKEIKETGYHHRQRRG